VKEKKLHRKLRKRGMKLIEWARRNGIDRVDVYVNAESGFFHVYVPDGESVLDFVDGEADE
jgi:hypothetical protein